MVICLTARLLPALLLAIGLAASAQTPKTIMNTRIFGYMLPRIPDAEGFAGTFAGVSNGALIVAGGANITGDKWAEPLAKKWYDSAFVLEEPNGQWKTGFKLPRPLGYGVCATVEDSVFCFGGSDATRHCADSFRLQWAQGKLRTLPLPALPRPCANACGALVGRTIYLAGGIETPASTEALHTFWALDLDAPEPIWRELEPWTGPARMLAVAGAYDGSFYLFSGAALTAGADGKPVREFLRDAYCFTPGTGWKRLADLPRATVAAPSPAPVVNALGFPALLVVSGDDGLNVTFQPVEKHPGFPRGSILYDPARDAWTTVDFPEISRATVPTVLWQNGIVIPNGEVRPRVRTPDVLGLQFP
jgi:N-acetylneuraminic acid mutarotase